MKYFFGQSKVDSKDVLYFMMENPTLLQVADTLLRHVVDAKVNEVFIEDVLKTLFTPPPQRYTLVEFDILISKILVTLYASCPAFTMPLLAKIFGPNSTMYV